MEDTMDQNSLTITGPIYNTGISSAAISNNQADLTMSNAAQVHMDYILQTVQNQIDIAKTEYEESGEDEDFGAYRALIEIKEVLKEAQASFVADKLGSITGRYGHSGVYYRAVNYSAQSIPAASISQSGWKKLNGV